MFWTSERIRTNGEGLFAPFNEGQVVNCSYELTLGPEGFVTGGKKRKKELLGEGEQLVIPPGQFALLLSEEVASVPADAIGFISVKSSFKLHGLVNVSGFHVDPGYRGRLIFSVYNAGGSDVVISRGERLFLMWFASLEGQTEDVYKGSRLEQATIPNKDIMAIGREHYSPAAVDQRLTAVEVRTETVWRLAIAAFASFLVGVALFAINTIADNNDVSNLAPPTTIVTSTTLP